MYILPTNYYETLYSLSSTGTTCGGMDLSAHPFSVIMISDKNYIQDSLKHNDKREQML
jgi:hypothetical protein